MKAYVGTANTRPDSQVGDRDCEHAEYAELDSVRVERRDGRRDGCDTRRDAHRDGEHVVRQQRRARHEAGVHAEVLPAHDVGAARARVGQDRLPVGAHDDGDEQGDAQRDRHADVERGRAREGEDQ